MIKKIFKLLLGTAVIGAAIAGGIQLYNKYKEFNADLDDDFDDFDDDFDDDFEEDDFEEEEVPTPESEEPELDKASAQ